MNTQNIHQYIEQFHLLFLDQLGRKIDKRLYALKGGCNLRFYFQSIRYSEDVDLDVQIIRKDTLTKNVQNILESRTLNHILQARSIKIVNITTPKQTDTTQRWKVIIDTPLLKGAHTKIEFSRRGLDGDILFEGVNATIVQGYHLTPILLSHYARSAAITQKIFALAGRSVTQARDVFDLYLLLGGNVAVPHANSIALDHPTQLPNHFTKALENISGLSYRNFLGQVVAFLPEEYQQQYSMQTTWQHIVTQVQQTLMRGLQCN